MGKENYSMRKVLIANFFLLYCSLAHAQDNNAAAKIGAIHGTYKHFLPCSDCTGIETTLTLDCEEPCNSGSYYLREESVNSINGDKGSESFGKWIISDTVASPSETSLVISLKDTVAQANSKNFFLLTADNLEQLDKRKQKIDPPFNLVLKKLDNAAILDLR
jgi:hypothetical protein